MIFKNLFFYIHYCNFKTFGGCGHDCGRGRELFAKKMTRTIPHHELILITGGRGSITIDQKSYSIHGGMLFYIWPDALHSFEFETEKAESFLSVHFSCARVELNEGRWNIQDQAEKLWPHPAQEIQDYYPIYDEFKRLVDTWNAKLPGYEFFSKAGLQQLFTAIYQNTGKENRNYGASIKVEKVINFMHQNIDTRVNLTELSEMVELSPPYLSRVFKETTGYSVIEYFNKIKIDKAKELIIEGDRKIKEIAGILGFKDEFYFSRIFKKTEGVSPSKFYSKIVHGV